MTNPEQTLREKLADALYDELRGAHRHPSDWLLVLNKPPIRYRRAINGWKRNREIFAKHGFILTERVADRYRLADSQRYDEDAGGAIIRRLIYALDGQLPPALGDTP